MDLVWWRAYIDEVNQVFSGIRLSTGTCDSHHMVKKIDLDGYGNSGAGSIRVAIEGGAKRIILLGFDCQHKDGKTHWHGNHKAGLANAKQVERWPELFQRLRNDFPDVEIINSSRETALTCFKRETLENALARE